MGYIEITSNDINKQLWQSQNLRVTRFANGDVIQKVHTNKEKEHAVNNNIPSWCFDLDDPNGIEILYNIHALNDARGLLPGHLRLPNSRDFDVLQAHLDNNSQNYEIFDLNHRRCYWSCSKFDYNEFCIFFIDSNCCGLIHSKGKEYYSVRGIYSNDKYLISAASELNPVDHQKIICSNLKADSLLESGKIKEAIEILEDLILLCTNNADLYFKIGKAYLALAKNEFNPVALKYLKKSIFLDPTRSEAFFFAGIASVTNIYGTSFAEPFFDSAIKLNAKSEYYLARAKEREKVSNIEGYLEDIEEANLEFIPDKYYEYSARLKKKKGNFLGAISDYDILINKHGNYGLYYYYRAALKIGLDNNSAINDFIKAKELDNRFNNDTDFLSNYGSALYLNGNLFKALQCLNDSIRITEQEGAIIARDFYLRASILHDLGNNEEALIDINKTFDNIVSQSSSLILQTKILLGLFRYDDALEVLKELKECSLESNDNLNISLYYFLCGEVYLRTNNRDLAYEHYKNAGDLGFKDGYVQIAKNSLLAPKGNYETDNEKFDDKAIFSSIYSINKAAYLNVYKGLLSPKEYQKVIDMVNSSMSLKKFIDSCKVQKILPEPGNFVKQVCLSKEFRFVFNYNKIDLACIELFDIWIREVNVRYKVIHEESLIYILKDLLKSSNDLASGKFR
jgi:tetratricopeptide (TPR) repeat protein